MRQLLAVLLLVFPASAQKETAPEPLVFSGKPVKVPVTCTEDDIQSLGMSCTAEQPCPVYLELASLEVVTGRMVVAGNLHTDSATLSSIVLVSEDLGKTWLEGFQRIRQGTLDQMQFFDLTHGWISGQVVAALPRDPFFLITEDGGKTWKQRPVFADPHLGSIEKFLFTSSTTGRVLVDRIQSGEGGRYALLESKTGGDTWSIVQLTQAPPAGQRWDRPPSAAWRLRANGAAKAYFIEKHEGQKWSPVSAFEVQPGVCAAAELELKPPAPPPSAEAETPLSDAVEVFQVGDGKAKKPEPKKDQKKKK